MSDFGLPGILGRWPFRGFRRARPGPDILTELEQVPTLDGTCTLRIPRGTHDGDLPRMKGRGMPQIGGGGRGDILARVVLEAPGSRNPRRVHP